MHQKPLFLISCALLLLLGCFAGGLLPPPTAHAQLSPNWPPVGTKWVYDDYISEGIPGIGNVYYKSYVENECLRDTMVNTTSYRVVQSYIRKSKGRIPHRIYSRYLLRADSHRVYMRSIWDKGQVSNESVIQDFSLNNGDTLKIKDEVFYTSPQDSVRMNAQQYGRITLKTDTVINGVKRRKYFLDFISFQGNGIPQFEYYFTFIEGIGPLESVSAYKSVVDPEAYPDNIRCYIEPGKQTVHFQSDTNCFFVDSSKWVSRNDLLSKLGLELYPNPANEYIVLKGLSNSINYSFALVSTTGQTIALPQPHNERIDLPALLNGLYLLQIKNAEGTLINTKLLIQS